MCLASSGCAAFLGLMSSSESGFADGVILVPGLLFLIFFFIRPVWGLAVFIIARSVADTFGARTLTLAGLSLNCAGFLGISVCIAGIACLKRLKKNHMPVLLPFAFLFFAVFLFL